MAYILGDIPYFRCLVRSEYLQDLAQGHGEYLPCTAVAVHCIRGDSLHFEIVLHEPMAGVAFVVPIEALVTKPCNALIARSVQPWDCFSSDFGVIEMRTLRRAAVHMLSSNLLAEYRFTIAFTGGDLADDPAQRKLLHVVFREDGVIGCYPNNRLVFRDRALFGDMVALPKGITTLTREFRAEGMGALIALRQAMANVKAPVPTAADMGAAPLPPETVAQVQATEAKMAEEAFAAAPQPEPAPAAFHTDPAHRPDWQQNTAAGVAIDGVLKGIAAQEQEKAA